MAPNKAYCIESIHELSTAAATAVDSDCSETSVTTVNAAVQ